MEVILTPQARKDFSRLPHHQRQKILKKLLLLEKEPLAGKKLGGKLANQRSLKAWPYRILYIIKEPAKQVWVFSILHRQGAYK